MSAPTNSLDSIFQALADSTRRDMLGRLIAGEATITTLAQNYEMSLPAVSKHLNTHERAGLITITKTGRTKTAYIEFDALSTAQIWLETLDDEVANIVDWDSLEADIESLNDQIG